MTNKLKNITANIKNPDWIYQFAEDYALIIALFIIAIWVRVYQFGIVPGGFNQDEAMSAYDGLLIARYGMDRSGMRLPVHFYAWGFGQQSAFMIYAMVPFYWIMGMSVVSARLPILLFSLFGLFAMYGFTRDAFGKKGLTIAVLAMGAINPWHIMQSRWALDCNMFPHLMMIGCWFLYRGLKSVEAHNAGTIVAHKSKIFAFIQRINYNPWLAGSMIAFAFCLYAYGIALYSVPVFLFAMTVYLLALNWRLYWKPLLISLAVFAAVAWPIIAMIIINYFHMPTFSVLGITIPFFHNNRTDELLFFGPYPRAQLVHNARSLTRILLQQDDLPWNTIPGYGTMFVWSIPFMSVGLFASLKFKQSMGKMILLFWFAMAVFAGLVVRGANVNQANIVFYPLIFLMGIGMYEAVAAGKKFRTKLAIAAMLVVISGASFTYFARAYFGEHGDRLGVMFYTDFFQGLDYAQELGYDRLYVTTHTRGHYEFQMTEVLLLFGAGVDPTSFFDHSFRDTYRVRRFHHMPYPPEDGVRALYLFNVHEHFLFPPEVFYITWHGGFGVARFR
ncbi:MAG: hypothetical protein FWC92_02040 [Defluviitaleaceae bacterium]|nr:hypothetical protein [Defluviitaleaceae bacterium]